jgi:hypothetical protein
MLPQLSSLRLQLEQQQEFKELALDQRALLDELRFLDGFFAELLKRAGATLPPGQGPKPTKICQACRQPIP